MRKGSFFGRAPHWTSSHLPVVCIWGTPRCHQSSLSSPPSPEQVPLRYGGVSREGEFTTTDAVTEEIIKPATKHTDEFPVSEACTLVWKVRAVGWEVCYGAEFTHETGYTVIIQKSRKISASEETVISDSFKSGEPGKVVLTFDNRTSLKKKLLFRSKVKPCE